MRSTKARSSQKDRFLKQKLLWFLVAAMVAVFLLAVSQRKGNSTQEPTLSLSPSPKVAAILDVPKAEEPPPRALAEPKEWKVLFTKPGNGKTGVLRSTAVDIFFDVPVERDIAEWNFAISPWIRGTISWPGPDHLVFTPAEALLPSTEYTVSLASASGSRAGEAYQLHEARWSFTTGDARTYEKDIRPLVSAYCHSCHGPNGSATNIPLNTYEDINRHIVAGRSAESPFYTFIQDRPHLIRMAGPNHSTNDKLAVIKDWIDQNGAAE